MIEERGTAPMKVGLAGKMGAGKTTIANLLNEREGFVKLSLAEPIKRIAEVFFGMKKGDPGYRELMQKIGTDWFRSVDEDVWVRHLFRSIADLEIMDPETNIVVDDVRFPNEAEAMLKNGWTVVYLDCPAHVRKQRLKMRDGFVEEDTFKHASETVVDKIKMIDGVKVVSALKDIEGVYEEIEWILCKKAGANMAAGARFAGIQFNDDVDTMANIRELVNGAKVDMRYEEGGIPVLTVETADGVHEVRRGSFVVNLNGRIEVWPMWKAELLLDI